MTRRPAAAALLALAIVPAAPARAEVSEVRFQPNLVTRDAEASRAAAKAAARELGHSFPRIRRLAA